MHVRVKNIYHALCDNGTHTNIANNDGTDVASRGCASLLECAKKCACELHTDAQDYVWHASRKETQPIDLN